MPPALRWWYLTFTLDESLAKPAAPVERRRGRQVSVFARVKVKYPWRKARGMNFKMNATEQKQYKPGTTINHRFRTAQAEPTIQWVPRQSRGTIWFRSYTASLYGTIQWVPRQSRGTRGRKFGHRIGSKMTANCDGTSSTRLNRPEGHSTSA